MKKIVPFHKELTFPAMIGEVTEISLEHTLEFELEEVRGNFNVFGKYKLTEASQIEDSFNYTLPFTVAIDSKYDTSNLKIDIDNFYYEIVNGNILNIHIEVSLDNLELKESISLDDDKILEQLQVNDEREIDLEDVEDLMNEEEVVEQNEEVSEVVEDTVVNKILEEKEYTPTNVEFKVYKDLPIKKDVSSIFSNLDNSSETYSTYYVYIVREDYTLDKVMEQYNVKKEELEKYNNLDDIKLGSKLIIPCSKNE